MKNVFLLLAFMLIGSFAFGYTGEVDGENPESVIKVENVSVVAKVETFALEELGITCWRTCYYDAETGELLGCTAWECETVELPEIVIIAK